jgi:hypothetical protein
MRMQGFFLSYKDQMSAGLGPDLFGILLLMNRFQFMLLNVSSDLDAADIFTNGSERVTR